MIIYDGPSLIDGQPIIAIATINSSNRKTGAMVQTWIMRKDIEPHHAIKTGADASVCGDCEHRPANNGSCYVLTFQAPLSIYRAFHRGSYDDRTIEQFAGVPLRLGSYGDPLAVPLEAWQALIDITELTMVVLSNAITKIVTPEGEVTENEHILDFLKHADTKTYEAIRDFNSDLRENSTIKPLTIVCTAGADDPEKEECGHEYKQPFTLNASDFFA